MKKISLLFSLVFCVCMSSYAGITDLLISPYSNDDEIKDYVRYCIAINQSIMNQINYSGDAQQYLELDEKIIAKYNDNTIYQDKTNRLRYIVQALARSNYKYSNYAQDILTRYDRISVALSDYQEIISGERWIFHELKTGITFFYTVYETGGDPKYAWLIEPDEDSVSEYVNSLLN